jgi:adenylate kinase
MVRERISRADCGAGAILDGFPRTPAQAQALSAILVERGADVTVVPFINGEPGRLAERIGGRLICRAHGHVYHQKFNPPKVDGKCDLDGSELFQREDDKAETVRHRIDVYMEQTAPLIQHYRAQGKLIEIDGMQPIERVTAALREAIGAQA